MGEQFKVMEYSLIILFSILWGVFILFTKGILAILLIYIFFSLILFYSHLKSIYTKLTVSTKLFSSSHNNKYTCQSSIEKYLANITILQSGHNLFLVKCGAISIAIYNTDSFYEEIFSYSETLSNAYFNTFSYLANFQVNLQFKTAPMHPIIANTYDMYLSMRDTTINLRSFLHNATGVGFSHFSSTIFSMDLLQFHTNIKTSSSLQNLIGIATTSLGLVVAVNIHTIIAFCLQLSNVLMSFAHSLIKTCGNYYDIVKDADYKNFKRYIDYFNSNNTNNNSNNGF